MGVIFDRLEKRIEIFNSCHTPKLKATKDKTGVRIGITDEHGCMSKVSCFDTDSQAYGYVIALTEYLDDMRGDYMFTWERLAKQEAEQFNKNAHGNATIECVEYKGRVKVKIHRSIIISYEVTDWESAYNMLCGMNEAYLLGYRWGL